jgi:hypothetical protein
MEKGRKIKEAEKNNKRGRGKERKIRPKTWFKKG